MEIFERVKICVYAAVQSSKDKIFVSWATAWLQGSDRTELSSGVIGSRARSAGSLSAQAANALAKSVLDPTNTEVYERVADKLVDSAVLLLVRVDPKFSLENFREDASAYADYIEAEEQEEVEYRPYLDKGKRQLSKKEWVAMLDGQEHCCAVCKRHRSKCIKVKKDKTKGWGLVVDHDHLTGEIRGLVCINCNWLIGQAKESIFVLRNTIEYLQKCAAEKLITS